VITGIVVALPEELSTLTAKNIAKGRIEPIAENILVAYSGVGRINAGASAELLVKQGVGSLISWGCAAALDASLQPGDLVLADTCIDADQVEINQTGMSWANHAQGKLTHALASPTRLGKLAESRAIVASSHDKAQIANVTGAAALDMESAAIARVAKLHGLPFLAVRAIADPLNMDLPKAVSHALNDQGEVILSKLLMFLLLHPSELPGLVKLGLHFKAARNTLKLVAKRLDVLTIFPQGTH
jgi:adenosylhomocysteine nucleosidase